MPTRIPNLHIPILILLVKIISHLIRNKHIFFSIHILIDHRIAHRDFARWQLSSIRFERFEFRVLHVVHVFTEMLDALHDGLALDFLLWLNVCGARGFVVHFVGDEGEFVGTLEEYVEGGLEFENGFEDGAAAEDVETQTGAGERHGEAADVTEVADAARAD
jgi:hypothetical protein